MLDSVIRFSLKNRVFVIAAALLMLVYGAMVLDDIPVDVFPDLNRPTVTVFLEGHGLAPEEIESLVTFPAETALNGATGVERVRSVSSVGLGLLFVEFGWGTDIYVDRQIVTEKLAVVRDQLPEGVAVSLAPITSIMGEIMLVAVTGDGMAPIDVRTQADWVLRPRLLSIRGVAQVVVLGGEVKQYRVVVRPERLAALGLTLHAVEEALRESNINTSGNFIVEGPVESMVRNIARIQTLEDIRGTVITAREGVPITIEQVADVVVGGPVGLKRGDAGLNGGPAVLLAILKQPGASTVDLTARIDTALDDIQATLPEQVRIHKNVFRQATFIEAAIHNVIEALRDGAIFVVIVLFLFLLNFRTTFITLTAIPLSLVVTLLVFRWFDMSINTMTLGGIAIAIGELVDDAIVDVENVFRRLKENRRLAAPRPSLDVVFEASSEIRNSIVFATVIVTLVFLPLFAMGGIEGRIFVPLGVAYVVSIVASLVVSLTVTPALASYLLPNAGTAGEDGDGRFVRMLKDADRRFVLRYTLTYPKATIGAAVAMLCASLLLLIGMGREFLPPFNEGSVIINLQLPPGTSLEESNRIGRIAENILREIPEIEETGRRTGRAELDEHAEGVHSSDIEVQLVSGRDSNLFSNLAHTLGFGESRGVGAHGRDVILDDIRNRLAVIPGVRVNIGQPIGHRIDHLLSGIRAQIAVKLFGSDLTTLREKAEEIRAAMAEVEGVVDLFVEPQVLIPQTRIEIDRRAVGRYGLRVGEVAEVLETALQGEVVGEVIEGQRRFQLVVVFPESVRESSDALNNILVDTPDGRQIPLRAVARVVASKGPNQILRENAQRRIVVQANVSERDLGSVVEEIQTKLATDVALPEGYFLVYGGQFESQQQASRLIGILSLFSLAGMILVLFVHLRSPRLVAQVLLDIPFAMIGAIVAIRLTGGTASIASLVAFITLCGIASRNGIMLLSHYLHLMRYEGESFTREMVVRGSLDRLVPVLMTALTTSLALVPLLLAEGEPGKEILYPVAVVVFGGLTTSALLDVVVTPAVFWLFGAKAAETVFAVDCPEELPRIFPSKYGRAS